MSLGEIENADKYIAGEAGTGVASFLSTGTKLECDVPNSWISTEADPKFKLNFKC